MGRDHTNYDIGSVTVQLTSVGCRGCSGLGNVAGCA